MLIEAADRTFTRGLEYLIAATRLQAMTEVDDTTRDALQRLSFEYRRRAYVMMGTTGSSRDGAPGAHQQDRAEGHRAR